ncbi:M3 family oligoendopeptidase [Candidatus Phytoplasma meliae]|uniref:M3 family oligoendopeptidase n=1 Tax=Candidatus Phytoplasma meliae TaxID=1848402 RepID=A0ABS5CYM3_9MOLU|nr:M3 family oligoendopeptidase [Candidatus Phytoplasma meliae]MBP5836074.1 M3 family oligoendopeptidase [Candidatus Phytoplasma meliae]
MQFQDFPYQRVDIKKIQATIEPMIDAFLTLSLKEQIAAIKEFHQIMDRVDSMFTLASIRNSLNVKDSFYQQEKHFCNQNGPLITDIQHKYVIKIMKSQYYQELTQEFGSLLFKQNHLFLKTFNPKAIPLLQQENELVTQYQNLISEPKVLFQNKFYNLSQMGPFAESSQRNIRKEAQLAVSAFFAKKEDEYDRIYDKLVKIRTKIAHLLGYDNFIQLGYDLLGRTDYTPQEISNYRKNIVKYVLPFYQLTQQKKSKRLGIAQLQSYDKSFSFMTGNPKPQGNMADKIAAAQHMYDEMSSETKLFFAFLKKKQLLDLDSKPNKTGGGYCTYLPQFEAPFIFANFNGTSHDVDVLTHEIGHAFQVYQSRHLIPQYRWPTLEAAEISSMGMEFLSWPWMKDFFGKDEPKYKFLHLTQSLNFLLYGALVDHFQHEVYQNPQMTPCQRKQMWCHLEQRYGLINHYVDDPFLQKGNLWLRQMHIFANPFYYIDYTLAQICALEIWSLSQQDYHQAWKKYLKLCQIGGSQSFFNLLKTTGLTSPFDENHLQNIIALVTSYLKTIDDTKY